MNKQDDKMNNYITKIKDEISVNDEMDVIYKTYRPWKF